MVKIAIVYTVDTATPQFRPKRFSAAQAKLPVQTSH